MKYQDLVPLFEKCKDWTEGQQKLECTRVTEIRRKLADTKTGLKYFTLVHYTLHKCRSAAVTGILPCVCVLNHLEGKGYFEM